jgi:hypothetical protein
VAIRHAIAAALAAILALPIPALAQDPDEWRDWARVQKLTEYTPLVVRLADGSRIKGSFVSADADGLTVVISADATTYARMQVKEVRKAVRPGWHKGIGLVLGGLLGMVVGAIVGAYIDVKTCHCDDDGVVGLVRGFWGGLIGGAILGFHLGGKGDGPVVYRAARA